MSWFSNYINGHKLLAPILAGLKGLNFNYVVQMAEQAASAYALTTLTDEERRARVEKSVMDRLKSSGVTVPPEIIHTIISAVLARLSASKN